MKLVNMLDLGSSAAMLVGSSPTTRTKMNAPTQSEQTVVSCSDWVGFFFVCIPCISRDTVFLFRMLCVTVQKQTI